MLTREQIIAAYERERLRTSPLLVWMLLKPTGASVVRLMTIVPLSPLKRSYGRMSWAIRPGMRCSHDLDQHQLRRYHGIIQGH